MKFLFSLCFCIGMGLPALAAPMSASMRTALDAYLDPALPALKNLGPAFVGQSARALSDAVVTQVNSTSLTLTHALFEDQQRHQVTIRFDGLTNINVKKGQRIKRGHLLGQRNASSKYVFIREGKESRTPPLDAELLFDPREDARIIFVSHKYYEMALVAPNHEGYQVLRSFKNGFGQSVGEKVQQGDNRTPKGSYHIVAHHRGKFTGKWGAYYGGHWIKISYPNAFDAKRGRLKSWISSKTEKRIRRAHLAKKMPPQGTKLGGGIGFHGWIEAWDDSQPQLSWGCIVMHNPDIKALYDDAVIGTRVVIF